jgi:hypothetical protein
MAKDFEYYVTKLAWEDAEFAEMLQKDANAALSSKGIEVPNNMKVVAKVQKKDTIYLSLPPKKSESSKSVIKEEMDVWSSGNFFIWFAPVANKFSLIKMRSSVPDIKG